MEKKSKFRGFLTRVGDIRLVQIWEKLRKPFNFCWEAGVAIFAIAFVAHVSKAAVRTLKDRLGLTQIMMQTAFLED